MPRHLLPLALIPILIGCSVGISLGPVSFGTGPGPMNSRPGKLSPQSITAVDLVPPGMELVDTAMHDLNMDGRADYLLVISEPMTRQLSEDYRLRSKSILLLTQNEDGSYREMDRNENLLVCMDCGSDLGDAYAGIEAGAGAFVVHLRGDSESESWNRDLSFRYHNRKKFWYLSHDETTRFDHQGKQISRNSLRLSKRKALPFGKVMMFSEE